MRRPRPIVPLLLAGTLLACPKEKEMSRARPSPPASPTPPAASPTASVAPTPSPDASRAATADKASSSEADRAREEACVDRWLSERKLDRYGSPQGTMYTGGTPLFNERTGQHVDRLDYVYRKHPEARAACAPARQRP